MPRDDKEGHTDTYQRQQQDKQPATKKPEETDALKLKKAWEIAIAPSKQLPMQAIMMYMSGNSLQIFSIMMVLMLFKGPIQGLINTNAAFAKYESPSTRARLVGVKAVYVLMQLLLLALGVWKVNGMGLLPYVPTIKCLCCVFILIQYTELRDRIGSHGSRSASLWNGHSLHSSDITSGEDTLEMNTDSVVLLAHLMVIQCIKLYLLSYAWISSYISRSHICTY